MEKEAQRKVIEFSMLEEENKRLEQQLQGIDQQILSFHSLKENVDELTEHKGEILASVGPGIFVKSELLDNKKILINVGAGIVLEKDCKNAQKIIDGQVKKLESVRKDIEKMAEKNFDAMIKIEGELRNLVKTK